MLARVEAPANLFGPFADWEEVAFFAVTVLLAGIALFFLYRAVKQYRRSYLILSNRPVPAGEVYLKNGTVELEGTAEKLERTINGKFSNKPTVAYSWKKKKKETRRDNNGRKKTNWKTVGSGEKSVPFLLTDESGSVAVNPDDANFSFNSSRQSGGGRRYRYYEGNIQPGDTVHIYGQKQEAVEADEQLGDDRFYIGDCDDGGEFLISDTTQLRTALRYVLSGLGYTFITLIVLGFAVVAGVAMLNDVFGIDVLSVL